MPSRKTRTRLKKKHVKLKIATNSIHIAFHVVYNWKNASEFYSKTKNKHISFHIRTLLIRSLSLFYYWDSIACAYYDSTNHRNQSVFHQKKKRENEEHLPLVPCIFFSFFLEISYFWMAHHVSTRYMNFIIYLNDFSCLFYKRSEEREN